MRSLFPLLDLHSKHELMGQWADCYFLLEIRTALIYPRDAQRDGSKRAMKLFFLRQRKGRGKHHIDIHQYREVPRENRIGERKKSAAVISVYATAWRANP